MRMLKKDLFPGMLKIAKVVPLYKTGDRDNPANYRPLSLLTSLSKVFEKIIYGRLFDYIDKFELFYPKQYGFRPRHSTVEAIAQMTETTGNSG